MHTGDLQGIILKLFSTTRLINPFNNFNLIIQHVGCDWVIDSDAREDKCGICLGNGEQCDTISGVYNKTTGSGILLLLIIIL